MFVYQTAALGAVMTNRHTSTPPAAAPISDDDLRKLLDAAISTLKKGAAASDEACEGDSWTAVDVSSPYEPCEVDEAIAAILNAVISGALVPAAPSAPAEVEGMVSELNEIASASYNPSPLHQYKTTAKKAATALTTLSAEKAELEAENERLREIPHDYPISEVSKWLFKQASRDFEQREIDAIRAAAHALNFAAHNQRREGK